MKVNMLAVLLQLAAVAVVLLGVVDAARAEVTTPGPNLLTNGDCEAGLPSLNSSGVGIYMTSSQSSTVAHGGTYSLKLQHTATSVTPRGYYLGDRSTRNGLTIGHTYRLAGWVYVPSGTGFNPDQIGFGNERQFFATLTYDRTHGQNFSGDVWLRFEHFFYVDGFSTKCTPVILDYNPTQNTPNFYVDDLDLRDVSATPEPTPTPTATPSSTPTPTAEPSATPTPVPEDEEPPEEQPEASHPYLVLGATSESAMRLGYKIDGLLNVMFALGISSVAIFKIIRRAGRL